MPKGFQRRTETFSIQSKTNYGNLSFQRKNETLWICSSGIVEFTFDRRAWEKIAKKPIFCWILKNIIYSTEYPKEVSQNVPLVIYRAVLTTLPKMLNDGVKFFHPKSKNCHKKFPSKQVTSDSPQEILCTQKMQFWKRRQKNSIPTSNVVVRLRFFS